MVKEKLIDRYGRLHNYLRISITDRCNLRCFYCMGPNGVSWLNPDRILKYEEILQVIKVAAELGIDRIRLTGGEPLVRKNLVWLIREIKLIPEISDLAMTTNGILLAEHAEKLRQAGLDRVNISLDTLKEETYSRITHGGNLNRVLSGIKAALAAGLHPVKINVVLMKGINDQDVQDLLQLAYENPLHVRFIEYMPLGNNSPVQAKYFLPLKFIKDLAAIKKFDLQPANDITGNGPAATYKLADGMGTIGFIHPISHHFCNTCNRLRLTADGTLKPCLYWGEELPVKPALGDPEKIRQLFFKAMKLKSKKHLMDISENRTSNFRSMSKVGG